MVCFAEPLEVYDLPGTEEADDVVYVGIVAEAEDIVVGNAGLLLCCVFVRTTQTSHKLLIRGGRTSAIYCIVK